ncbi:unnamed protein product (macronuclear) [Paramecium tetraurelia]|uniref:Band 7 domain-containing protein n=1 Tax=Paramecium tetraurelia TaxID=5888 RepID=A0E8T9_PARTE|nr:uncharacterized protein GSPATT00024437001 [Paramecium tetraurelia]CAK91706.1 unnamed protein product [Paramecium tetraurelia]|eukprot:XP_001459103.1 hypothetical protein (macronuclear) [Paramecium tetraurelia strain d4-2]
MNAHSRRKIAHLEVPEFQDNQTMIAYAKCQYCLGECFGCLRTWIPCIFCMCVNYPYQEVEQGTEGLFKRFGRHIKVVRPGLHYVNPCTDTLEQLDLRITVIDLDRQSVMTKDNVTISIDASVYYRIKTSRFAVYRVENYDQAVRQITYAVLKNTVGSFVLQDLLEKRQEVADQIEDQVDEYVKDWGVLIDNIYMKDIQLSPDLQQALGSAATEQRLAQGKLISAKADVESAKLMRQASEFLDSKTAMQVRYLETLQQLAGSNGTKVCFVPDEKNQEKLMHQITQGLLA